MVGSLVLGIKIALNMKARLRALRELERIISYIEGELRYRHAVLNEALYNVSLKCGHPFDMWLGDLSQRLKVDDNSRVGEDDDVFDNKYLDFHTIWCESLGYLRDNTQLISKDIGELRDVGKALGYLDIESQQMNLAMERELIHQHILTLDKDLSNRMKSAVIMCFLGGIMTVIALL